MRVIAKLYRYRGSFSQSDETAGIQKQLKDEMSADLTAFKKKGLDRKTNHQDLTKVETEEIFVLSKAIQGKETLALKLEQKAVEAQEQAKALPRPARPPPLEREVANHTRLLSNTRSSSTGGRKETNRGNRGSMLWLATLCKGTRPQPTKG